MISPPNIVSSFHISCSFYPYFNDSIVCAMGVCFFLRSKHKLQWNQGHKSTKSNEGRKKGRTERKGGEEERKKGGKAGQKEGRKID